ncbi:hypothetical protein ABTG52_10210, partial [Acinetobacter baumannii]
MAVGSGPGSLEETPTWAVATVCFVILAISIIMEQILHLIGKWLQSKHKKALYEALEKVKSELMLLGFISLLLTVGKGPISNMCISKGAAATWHPCGKKLGGIKSGSKLILEEEHSRKLLMAAGCSGGNDDSFRRILAVAAGPDKCAAKGKAP